MHVLNELELLLWGAKAIQQNLSIRSPRLRDVPLQEMRPCIGCVRARDVSEQGMAFNCKVLDSMSVENNERRKYSPMTPSVSLQVLTWFD